MVELSHRLNSALFWWLMTGQEASIKRPWTCWEWWSQKLWDLFAFFQSHKVKGCDTHRWTKPCQRRRTTVTEKLESPEKGGLKSLPRSWGVQFLPELFCSSMLHPIASSKRTPGVRTGFQVVFLRPRRSNTWDLFTGTLAILDLLPQRSQMVPDV